MAISDRFRLHRMGIFTLTLIVVSLLSTSVFCQNIELLKDINTIENPNFGSDPDQFVAVGNGVFFVAFQEESGRELWTSDGTAKGTVLVKDITPGTENSMIYNLINHNGTVFFTVIIDTIGVELWKSDGTENGTVLVKTIPDVKNQRPPHDFITMNGILYFVAKDNTNGEEIWRSDGSVSGTYSLDLFPGYAGSNPQSLVVMNDFLFFSARDTLYKNYFWKSEGTFSSTVKISNSYMDSLGDIWVYNLTVVQDQLFFSGLTDSLGLRVWKSDGTENGTIPIPTTPDSTSFRDTPSWFTPVGNDVYFVGSDNTYGSELWKINGSTNKATLVKDLLKGSLGFRPYNLLGYRDSVYFRGYSSSNIWRSDGTQDGTLTVIRHQLGQEPMIVFRDKIYFIARDKFGNEGNDLWESDGTRSGTHIVRDIFPGRKGTNVQHLTVADSVFFFSAYDPIYGQELWISDGTESGTKLVKNINSHPGGSNPNYLVTIDSTLYFAADDGVSGSELWKSNGSETTTHLVKDLTPSEFESSSPVYLTAMDGLLYFGASSSYQTEVWRSDGTESGTEVVKRIGYDHTSFSGFASTDYTFFFKWTGLSQGTSLWGSRGSESTTHKLPNFPGLIHIDLDNFWGFKGLSYFVLQGSLWSSDGSGRETKSIKFCDGGCLKDVRNLCASGNSLLFTALREKNNLGTELWKIDSKTSAPVLVKDIRPGSSSSSIEQLTPFRSSSLFVANSKGEGPELWITNGTSHGTLKIKNFHFTDINRITAGSKMAYFLTNNLFSTSNLWKTDGTQEGTTFVKSFFIDFPHSKITSMICVDDILFFTLFTQEFGSELWRSDGTPLGTQLVEDLMPGEASSNPNHLTAGHHVLYFTADHPTFGNEVFYVRTEPDIHVNNESLKALMGPNPTAGNVSIHLPIDHLDELTVYVYDCLGRKVHQSQSASNPILLDLGHLASGTYVIRMSNGFTNKFIKY